MNNETAPRFSGIGGHHSHKAGTVEWLTPPDIIAALGTFDLDPCAPIFQPYPTASRVFTKKENGLIQDWGTARAWVNPPYANGEIEKWLARIADHNHGTALIFARTETDAFFRFVWERAAGVLFMRGRINFFVGEPYTDQKTGKRYEVGDRAPGNAGAPTVLCAYGATDLDVLSSCSIAGAFVPLRFSKSVLAAVIEPATWADLVRLKMLDADGPVHLDDLYRAVSDTQKAKANPNYEAKVRQQLQRGRDQGDYFRHGPGLWEAARKEPNRDDTKGIPDSA